MLLLKDLGYQHITGRSRKYGLYLCSSCLKEVVRRQDTGNKQLACGECPNVTEEPSYSVWEGIKQRCLNPKSRMFKWYGAKGITICPEWKDSKSFILWAKQSGYKKGLTIDRIDNTKGYSPDNCQWLTRVDNLNKDRGNRKSQSKITKTVMNRLKYLSNLGFSSTQISTVVNLSPRYIRQLLSKDFIPRSIM